MSFHLNNLSPEIFLFSVSPAHDSWPLIHLLHYFAATCPKKTAPGSKPRPVALLSNCIPDNMKWGHTPGTLVLLCYVTKSQSVSVARPRPSPHPSLLVQGELETDKEPLPHHKIFFRSAVKMSQQTLIQKHTYIRTLHCLQDLCCGSVYRGLPSLL